MVVSEEMIQAKGSPYQRRTPKGHPIARVEAYGVLMARFLTIHLEMLRFHS
jgi:hypothetical protein